MSIHDQKLYQAIDAIKAGDKDLGKQLLIEILKVDQRNEAAWLWMSQAVINDTERLKCLRNVLKINPGNEIAQKAIQRLDKAQVEKRAIPPPQLPPPESSPALPSTPKQIKSIKPLAPKLPDSPRPVPTPPVLPKPAQEPQPAPLVIPQKSDRQLIEEAIAKYTARGFQVVSQTETSVQLRKPKQWSQLLLVFGCFTLIIGFGLLILIIAAIDYAMKKEQVVFITAQELRYQETFKNKPTLPGSNQNLIVAIAIAFIVFVCSIMVCGPAMLQGAKKVTPKVTPITTPRR